MKKQVIACLTIMVCSMLGSLSPVYAETTNETSTATTLSSTSEKNSQTVETTSSTARVEQQSTITEKSQNEEKTLITQSALRAGSESQLKDAEGSLKLLPHPQTLKFNDAYFSKIEFSTDKFSYAKESKNHVIIPYDTQGIITITYDNAATEIATGRTLNLTLTISDFYFREGLDKGNHIDGEIEIGFHVKDNIRLLNLYAAKEQFHFQYADGNKEKYNDSFYLTTGSLNFQRLATWDDKIPNYIGASRYEFSSPVSNYSNIYVPTDSEISSKLQELSGLPFKGENRITYGFMGPSDKIEQGFNGDDKLETYTKFGITYLAKNDFSFFIGTSGREGRDPEGGKPINEKNEFIGKNLFIDAFNNHAIVSLDTAIPYLAFELDISKVDNFTGKALAGATFTLTQNDDQTKVKTVVSGSDGKLSFDTLIPGKTYTLAETGVPDGYADNKLAWQVSVLDVEPNAQGKNPTTQELALSIKDNQGKNLATFTGIREPQIGNTAKTYQYTMEVRNLRKGLLPKTGSSGKSFYYTVAIISAVAAASIYGWTMYRSRKESV